MSHTKVATFEDVDIYLREDVAYGLSKLERAAKIEARISAFAAEGAAT